jgi:uncharacterized OB-fold protein
MMPLREPGWECPKCLRIWAPKINACMACNDRGTLDHVPVRFTCEDPKWNFNGDDESFA